MSGLLSSFHLARLAADLAAERKASDIVLLNLAALCSVTDYFVLCTGRSDVQVQAICRHIEEGMETHGLPAPSREGVELGQWALLDYGTVVVHVFQRHTRRLYDLERLWIDAPRWSYDAGSPLEAGHM